MGASMETHNNRSTGLGCVVPNIERSGDDRETPWADMENSSKLATKAETDSGVLDIKLNRQCCHEVQEEIKWGGLYSVGRELKNPKQTDPD